MTTADASGTRDRILFYLKTRGPLTTAQLARRLGITAVGARQHLQRLEEEALVRHHEQRGSVGRPARIWELRSRAAERFPEGYADLTVDLLGGIREAFGGDGLDRLVEVRTRRQLEQYRDRMPDGDAPLADRVSALVALRSEDGYMAACEPLDDGWLLVENHCPICAAATVCQGLCGSELELFRAVLGDEATVERAEHMLAGDRRCTYVVRPTGDGGGSDKVEDEKPAGGAGDRRHR